MTPKVLIVDDDAAWLTLMQRGLTENSAPFSVVTAPSGKKALEILAGDHVSAVVSDLRMPGIDGFELLNRLLHRYPDIPVMIVTAYDRPKTREVVFKSGASDYLVKPFSPAELAERVNRMLRSQSEGGSLHNVSLETFLQLIEMEGQTCTLRAWDRSGSKMGVLFFKDGELMNARLGGRQGNAAAYEILSWSGVSLSIENACAVAEKNIDGGLQAILLNAMRSKDESRADFDPSEEPAPGEPASPEPPPGRILLNNPVPPRAGPAETARQRSGPAGPESAVDAIRAKLAAGPGPADGVEDIYEDPQYNGLIEQAAHIGRIFGSGRLNAVYLGKKEGGQRIIVPGERAIVVAMSPEIPRDRVIELLL